MLKYANVKKVIYLLLFTMASVVVTSALIDVKFYDATGSFASIVFGGVGVLMSVFIAVLILLVHKDNVEWRRAEKLEMKRNVLDGIYIELNDVYDHIKSRYDLYVYKAPDVPPIKFTNAYFYHDTYDKVLNSLQVHDYDFEINKVKKIIHNIKEHNRIWLKFDSVTPDVYGKEQEIQDATQIQIYCRRLEGYERLLIKDIPVALQDIKNARDRLVNHRSRDQTV